MSELNEEIIIVRKKKVVHGGHHGGAWKVAYADFVTAMMSLFIVLWLLSSSNETIKKSVAGYFNDPKGNSTMQGSSRAGVANSPPITKDDLKQLKERLLASAQTLPNFERLKKQIDISASPDGLRIELMEEPGGTFFESGSATPTPAMRSFLTLIAKELGKMPNKLSIEGHTDARRYSTVAGYSNWELSADRANAARRLMQNAGVGEHQVAQVRGFADQLPRDPQHPEDARNRRITLIVDPIAAPEPSAQGREQIAEAHPGSPEKSPSEQHE